MTEEEELAFEMRPVYDLSNARPNRYAARAIVETTAVIIEPELFEKFPSSEAVNWALREFLKVREAA